MLKAETLFLVVLASTPVQLGKFFFPNYSYVFGIPIDYRAQAVYLSDIAIVLYVVFSLIALATSRTKSNEFKRFYLKKNPFILPTITLFVSYIIIDNFLTSVSRNASLYFSLKIIEFSLLSIFAALDFSQNSLRHKISSVISFSIIWQFVLVLVQFISQKSLGLWFIGERALDSTSPNIAHFNLFGLQLLRPYGTFPHPNLLGAFLVVFTIINLSTRSNKLPNLIAAAAVLFSFSKGALLALIATLITYSKGLKQLAVRMAVLILFMVLSIRLISTAQIASLAERLTLIQASFDLALTNPIFGIGSNNFILELSKLNLTSISQVRLLQPVHNVFLLILVENGILGLLLFALLLFIVARNVSSKPQKSLFLAILIFASLDHFLWTLQQGLMIFWLSIAFIYSSQKVTSN